MFICHYNSHNTNNIHRS